MKTEDEKIKKTLPSSRCGVWMGGVTFFSHPARPFPIAMQESVCERTSVSSRFIDNTKTKSHCFFIRRNSTFSCIPRVSSVYAVCALCIWMRVTLCDAIYKLNTQKKKKCQFSFVPPPVVVVCSWLGDAACAVARCRRVFACHKTPPIRCSMCPCWKRCNVAIRTWSSAPAAHNCRRLVAWIWCRRRDRKFAVIRMCHRHRWKNWKRFVMRHPFSSWRFRDLFAFQNES